ncbi:MAG: hypothetical protein Q9168_003440 [Polycauliona sp. 1 TL-2023]
MSVTSTDTITAATARDTIRFLGSSIDSLSPPRQRNSHISNVYKEASTLFLTRRLAEAYSTLEPILTIPEPSNDDGNDGDEDERTAPIATAGRSLRVKCWSLYLTLLNAIIQLGSEQGTQELGSKRWHGVVVKTQDGTIWDEVVQMGYGGIEGNVDADVVTNLATLLLSHSSSQKTNQQHLETYLATSNHSNGGNLADSAGSPKRRSRSRYQEQSPTPNGTNTPRELASALKILELYILHVLPANDEWDYAKEFIQMSETLDDERKDIFQQALSQLEAEKTQDESYREDDARQQNHAWDSTEEANQLLQAAEPKPVEEDNNHHPHSHRRSNSERDYGIEELKKKKRSDPTSIQPSTSSTPRASKANQQRNNNKSSQHKTSPRKTTNSGILARSAAIITAFQNMISNMTLSMSKNPSALLRSVLFLVALLVALSRRDVKERVARITGAGWEKVKRTVGMGVKVSYI